MTITINLEPETEERLEDEARRRGLSVPEYISTLLQSVLPAPAGVAKGSRSDAQAFEEARQRIRAAMAADPEFAARVRQPLSDEPPLEDPVLQDAYSRKYSDQLFEEHYGKDLADEFRARLGG